MKTSLKAKTYTILLFGLILILTSSCKKTYVPTLSGVFIGTITKTTLKCAAQVSSNGGANVTACGMCWSTTSSPTIADSKTVDGMASNGSFETTLTGLNLNTKYYLRAYATNSVGTAYSEEVSFTTEGLQVPVVTTSAVTLITDISATCGGNVISDDGIPVTERGVCWSTVPAPTTSDSKTSDGVGLGSYASYVTGLTRNTTYYMRAYAINATGTGYGNTVTFSTYEALAFAIGTNYQGGIIAYVLKPNDPGYILQEIHGLIVAPTDQGSMVPWGCEGTQILGADLTTIGSGNQNTIDIINGCSTTYIAARLCADLVLGGYNDWYLPSKDELNAIYLNRSQIPALNANVYWSSSEYNSLSYNYAWSQNLANGIQNPGNKGNNGYVRAVRSF